MSYSMPYGSVERADEPTLEDRPLVNKFYVGQLVYIIVGKNEPTAGFVVQAKIIEIHQSPYGQRLEYTALYFDNNSIQQSSRLNEVEIYECREEAVSELKTLLQNVIYEAKDALSKLDEEASTE